MLDMIPPVPRRMPGAEAFFHIAGRRAEVNRRSIIHRGTRKEPLQVRTDVSQTRPRNRLRVFRLDCAGCADEIVRNSQADSEMVREIVAASKAQIVYRPVPAGAAFESRPEIPTRVESLIGFRTSAGRRVRTLRLNALRSDH